MQGGCPGLRRRGRRGDFPLFRPRKWLTDLTSCRVDTGETGTAVEEEVSEHSVQDMWSPCFASEPIPNPTLF